MTTKFHSENMGKKTKDQILKALEIIVEVCGALLLLLPFLKRQRKKGRRR